MNPTSTQPYIGYILKRYPRFSETFVVNEILAHERAGTKIDIFALGPVEETHFQDGISQVRAPVTRLNHKQHKPEAVWQLIQQGFAKLPGFSEKLACAKCTVHELAQSISIALIIRERSIQHLHAHFGTQATTVARLAALFAEITYTFTAHAKDIYFQYEESTGLAQKMRDAFATVTVSDYNLAYLKQEYGQDADKAVRIYNGMDLSKFPYESFSKREPHILAVGRLVIKKGFDVLLEALALLKQQNLVVHCTLVGGGSLQAELEAQIQRLNISDIVKMVGPMPQPDIINMMKHANMVVAPCVISEDGDRDGLPTVLLESMALGTPVISTQVAGIPELVKDGETGLCVPERNPQALAAAMQRLLQDSALCATFSRNGRALIKREFDEDRNASLLRQIFTAAVTSQK
ncbi:glycosyltransferase family 4 protein [Neisseria perflava]|uniref:glycosyltransferase family 4 protein n=1 Tax=Neisseria perflava TaxID=33053 RepID=UPI00209E9A81|nr:glycosyltransferase family 4 protein [Neisseria perflava]MCP1659870.1 glycosyltransferase involved in cell wall biosynthesis [Neisseria perflava]MCP1772674.1 glycosyltransferase involved in cell wall biosynthesis [Neisseria perflava]